jgi:hypothetical protein
MLSSLLKEWLGRNSVPSNHSVDSLFPDEERVSGTTVTEVIGSTATRVRVAQQPVVSAADNATSPGAVAIPITNNWNIRGAVAITESGDLVTSTTVVVAQIPSISSGFYHAWSESAVVVPIADNRKVSSIAILEVVIGAGAAAGQN